jgi:hypothetical protein
VWLRGSATNGRLDLVSADGGSRLTGTLSGESVAGELVVGPKSWNFTAVPGASDVV